MAITVTAKTHYDGLTGDAVSSDTYIGKGVTRVPASGTEPEHDEPYWHNARYTVVTDEYGAYDISISGLSVVQLRTNRLRVDITTDDASHKLNDNGTYKWTLSNSGTITITLGDDFVWLEPRTTYYVWIYCTGGEDDEFDDSEISITASYDFHREGLVVASNGQFGSPRLIVATPPEEAGANLRYSFYTSCAGRKETLQAKGSRSQFAWTPDSATYAALLPNSGSASATVYCAFYSGGRLLWVSDATITLSFGSDVAPTVTTGWATHSVYNTGSAAESIPVYVQGYSKAEVTFDITKVTFKYGATFQSYSISCEGVTASSSPYRTGVLGGTTASIVCTVTDSRGLTASETLTVTLYPYLNPRMSDIHIAHFKYDDDEHVYVEAEDGSYIGAIATAIISSLNGNNHPTLSIYTKLPNGTYTLQSDQLVSGEYTYITLFSPNYTWDVKLTLTDSLGNSVSFEQRLPTIAWAMKFRENGQGVGFGKAPEYGDAIEVPDTWAIYFGEKKVYPDMMGSLELTDTATAAHAQGSYFLWKHQLVECTAAISAGGTISSSNVSVTSIAAELAALAGDISSESSTLSGQIATNTAALARISVQAVEVDDQTVGASTYTSTPITLDASRTGYTPIGIVGYNISNATNGGARCSFISVYQMDLTGTTVTVNLRNHNSGAAKIKVTVYVLYI